MKVGSRQWQAKLMSLAKRYDALAGTAYASFLDHDPSADDRRRDQIIRARHRARFGSGEHT